MKKKALVLCSLICSLNAAGCNRHPDNLLFVDTNVLGVSAGGTQGAFKLGFTNVDYFSVPVVRKDQNEKPLVLAVKDGADRTGTFSAIALFDATSQGCLGRAAAVGFAARKLAEVATKRC